MYPLFLLLISVFCVQSDDSVVADSEQRESYSCQDTMELSHEFSIEEYQDIEASINPGNDMDAATSVAHEEQNDVPKECEEIISASPMHFRRVPRQNSPCRFALVTSESQLK